MFSFVIVVSYIKYRQSDFLMRLHNRAVSSVNMLVERNNIDSSMLRIIDNNIVTIMRDLHISIYDKNDRLVYCNQDTLKIDVNKLESNALKEFFSLGYKTVNFTYKRSDSEFRVIASAFDLYGINELNKLLSIILWVFIGTVIFIIGFGFYNAKWSLRPFRKLINEVENIDTVDFKKRLSTIGKDEISQLSKTFNSLLDRIEQAFETEKSFISSASHELQTPVTSILGQIEVILNKTRNEEEYKNVLQSVYDDTSQMAVIINGFLDLAEANLANNKIQLSLVRIDELIFSIVDDFERSKPLYNISVEFVTSPELDSQIECYANERLLRLMFSNLIDNACKYSDDKKAKVKIDFTPKAIIVIIIDYGIGVEDEDIENIFKPMYRGKNTSGRPGHGIGLAIVKRIADFHRALITIHSEINIGTTVNVYINRNK